MMWVFLAVRDQKFNKDHAFNVQIPEDIATEDHHTTVIRELRAKLNAELDRAEEAKEMPRFVHGWDGCGKYRRWVDNVFKEAKEKREEEGS